MSGHVALERSLWGLEADICFLNHGSFGATPLVVLQQQRRWQQELERQPVQFFLNRHEGLMDEVRRRLGAFVGADPDDLALVHNATTGVATVLASMEIPAGAQLLATTHGYNACNNALRAAATRASAEIRWVELPFAVADEDEYVARVLEAVTPSTVLALLDHVTSPTGLVLPLERLVPALESQGVRVLVDGAHAPGMIPLDLTRLGASYYTGNCHKWVMSPKGSAFLHVRRDRQSEIRPLVTSHGANSPRVDRSRFRLEFDWTGTEDPSAWLSVPAALDWVDEHGDGWPAHMAANRSLALEARQLLCRAFCIPSPAPDSMIGALAAVPIPADAGDQAPGEPAGRLQRRLWDRWRVEVPIIPWGNQARLLRVSAQRYNAVEDYERLIHALTEEGFGQPSR
jgi:isopenicillin-N epimerase